MLSPVREIGGHWGTGEGEGGKERVGRAALPRKRGRIQKWRSTQGRIYRQVFRSNRRSDDCLLPFPPDDAPRKGRSVSVRNAPEYSMRYEGIFFGFLLGEASRGFLRAWEPVNVAQVIAAPGLLSAQIMAGEVLLRDCLPLRRWVASLSGSSRPITPGDISKKGASHVRSRATRATTSRKPYATPAGLFLRGLWRI